MLSLDRVQSMEYVVYSFTQRSVFVYQHFQLRHVCNQVTIMHSCMAPYIECWDVSIEVLQYYVTYGVYCQWYSKCLNWKMTLTSILMMNELVCQLRVDPFIYMGRNKISLHINVARSTNTSVMLCYNITQTELINVHLEIVRCLETL